jgi:quinol monooxygenase YgiN
MIDKIVLVVHLQTRPGKKAQFLIHLDEVVETMSAEPNFVDAIIHHKLDSPNDG